MALSLLGPATAPFPTTVFDNTGPADGTLPALAGIIRVNHAHRDYVITGLGSVADTINYIDGGHRLGAEIRLRIADAAAPITFDPSNALSNLDIPEAIILRATTEWLHLMRGADGWNIVGIDSENEVVATATVDAADEVITIGANDAIDVTIDAAGPFAGSRLTAGTVNGQKVRIRNTSATLDLRWHRTELTSLVLGAATRHVHGPGEVHEYVWNGARWVPQGRSTLRLETATNAVGASPTTIAIDGVGDLTLTPVAERTQLRFTTTGMFLGQIVRVRNASDFGVKLDTFANSGVDRADRLDLIPPRSEIELVWDATALSVLNGPQQGRMAAVTVAADAAAINLNDALVTEVTVTGAVRVGITLTAGERDNELRYLRVVGSLAFVFNVAEATSRLQGASSQNTVSPGMMVPLQWNATSGRWMREALPLRVAAQTRNMTSAAPADRIIDDAFSAVNVARTGAATGNILLQNFAVDIDRAKMLTCSSVAGGSVVVEADGAGPQFVFPDGSTVNTLTFTAVNDCAFVLFDGTNWRVLVSQFSADTLAADGAISLLTPETQFNISGGSIAAATLANGLYLGQRKLLRVGATAGANTVVINPDGAANFTWKGATLATATLSALEDFIDAAWDGNAWAILDWFKAADTLTAAAGAINPLSEVTFITPAAPDTINIANGVYVGQRKTLRQTNANAATVTPATAFGYQGATLASIVLPAAGDYIDAVWDGTRYEITELSIARDGVAQGVTAHALSLETNVATTGAGVVTLLDPLFQGQRKTVKFLTDAGDATVTPTTAFHWRQTTTTTVIFQNVGDFLDLVGEATGAGIAWRIINYRGVPTAANQVVNIAADAGDQTITGLVPLVTVNAAAGGLADTATLSNGIAYGQRVTIACLAVGGGTYVVTVTTCVQGAGTTITFNAVDQAVTLEWFGTSGWGIIGALGAIVIG